MTRSMTAGRRATSLAVSAAAVALAMAGCSAGQIAETALKQSSVSGVTANSADGKLAVRGLAVAYEGVEGYPAGGTAPLEVALFNQTGDPITVLVGVAEPERADDPTATTARQVLLTGAAGSPSATPASATPSPAVPSSGAPSSGAPQSPEAPEGEAAAPNTSGSASPESAGNAAEPQAGSTGSPSPSPASSATAAAPTTGQPAQITIPASSLVMFNAESAQRLSLVGLADALRSGMSVTLTFQVTQGSEQSELLTVRAPVAIPLTAAPRETGHAEEHEE